MSTLITTTVQGIQNIKYDASTTAMTINSAGIVTMPNHPAFSASRDAGDVSVGDFIVFDDARTNVGNHYSTSTGKFTAPVAGTYAFFFYGMSAGAPTNVNISVEFWKNNSYVGDASPLARGSGSGYSLGIQISGQIILTLAVNDFVQVKNSGGSGGGLYMTGNAHNEFSGHLIG